jgi:hypothetical protein
MFTTDLNGVSHHPAIEEIVEILCNKTRNTDRGFFRVEVAYYLAKMAASMRVVINTKDRGEIPVNGYTMALATSGFGKGHSIRILEQDILGRFKSRFVNDTFPVLADQHLWKLAIERAAYSGKTEEEEHQMLEREFNAAGQFLFDFDSGTPAAVKQMRQKLLLAKAGAINLQIDEIGSNLMGSTDVLNLYLELYDQGVIKQKLVKNTTDNVRGVEIDGKTPANMLLFGTPSKLLDGHQVEDHFYSFLETGYARRCLFAWGEKPAAEEKLSAAERYALLTNPTNGKMIDKWAGHFWNLADPAKYNWQIDVDDSVGIELLTYQDHCEAQAEIMPEHDTIRKAEISHRHFKALKLAGALAYTDESCDLTMAHLHQAIKLVEESGRSFQKLLTREKNYMKLAKYLAETDTPQTHADLDEALPFYKSGNAARNEIMTLATAWGYKNHIIVKKTYDDGVEMFSGESLKETDIDQMMLSYSDHFAYHYQSDTAPFTSLHKLTQAPDMHWANHRFVNEHRSEENVIPGFNMVVLDVDGGTTLNLAHELLEEYTFMTYTTKRHTDEANRFRLILPINYVLELDVDEYKEFMKAVVDWLPFEVDRAANQRSRKWQSNDAGSFHYNDGELLDCLPFIPKTSRNDQYRDTMKELESLDNLERWFAQRIASGNRNNQMIRFALALVDSGMTFNEVERAVLTFNGRLNMPLQDDELRSTVLVTVAKKMAARP